MSLEDAFSGATPQGSSAYQTQVVKNAAATSKPYYLRGLNDARQRAANQGLAGSPAALASQGAVGENYQNNLAGVSGQAAVDAAQLQEQNRVREQSRQWHLQDLASEREWQRELMRRGDDRENAGRWDSLIGDTAGAAGMALGGPVGAMAGKGIYNWLNGGGQQLDENGTPIPQPPE